MLTPDAQDSKNHQLCCATVTFSFYFPFIPKSSYRLRRRKIERRMSNKLKWPRRVQKLEAYFKDKGRDFNFEKAAWDTEW